MSKDAERWLDFAREDIRMAELALQWDIFNQTCFHSQQCTEKALKSLISSRGTSPPRTHRLVDILSMLEPALLADIANDIQLLDRFYIPTRYPDALPGALPDDLPTRQDAEQALTIAQQVLKVADEAIKQVRREEKEQSESG